MNAPITGLFWFGHGVDVFDETPEKAGTVCNAGVETKPQGVMRTALLAVCTRSAQIASPQFFVQIGGILYNTEFSSPSVSIHHASILQEYCP